MFLSCGLEKSFSKDSRLTVKGCFARVMRCFATESCCAVAMQCSWKEMMIAKDWLCSLKAGGWAEYSLACPCRCVKAVQTVSFQVRGLV